MKISQAGLNLVKAFEGCLKPTGDGHFAAYRCPANVLTIGYGHTCHNGRQFTADARWTQSECDYELASDMGHFERAVEKLVKVPLAQHQFDALVSFAFNCGEGALAGSTLLKRVNANDMESAAREFHKWNKGGGGVLPGLVRRRASESLMFQGIADADFDGRPDKLAAFEPESDPMPQAVDAPPETPDINPPWRSLTNRAAAALATGFGGVTLHDFWNELTTPAGASIVVALIAGGCFVFYLVIKGRANLANIAQQLKSFA